MILRGDGRWLDARRIVVLVPHPDDEVVGCATAMTRLRLRTGGARVFALYLTTGLPAREIDWSWRRSGHDARVRRRRDEAARAAQLLGIEPIDFTDWPSRQLKTHLGEARDLIRSAVVGCAADAIWTPAYEGGHQDHDVTNFLASTFRAELPVTEFSEYNAAGGVRSHTFPTTFGTETVLELSAQESAAKARALAVYQSERRNLGHIAFARESLRPLANYDYRRPPHAGTVFYQRYAWVPFRHPRVDFTAPAEVSAALARFKPPSPPPPHL